jgi:hypothetical protein
VPSGDNHQTIVTLDASASTDPDGDALTYAWTVPSGRFEGGTSASDAVVQVSFPGAAPYRVTLVVSDGQGGSDSQSFTIQLSSPSPPPANRAPSASISSSHLSIPAGDNHATVVTLDGSGSSDPDGDQLTFSWTVPGGQFVSGSTASDAVTRVTFPGAAPYTVTLVVDDGHASNSASLTITLR